MGDGRYYTYRQFLQILFLTSMSGYLTYTILFLKLKSRVKESIKMIVISLSIMLSLMVVGFAKELVYEIEAYVVLSYVGMFIIEILMISWIIYYTKKRYLVYIAGGIVVFLVGTDYIKEITYHSITYTHTYILTIGIMTSCIIALLIRDVVRFYPRETTNTNKLLRYNYYKSIMLGIGIGCMTISYLLNVIWSFTFPIHEVGVVVGVIFLNIAFIRFMPEEKIPAGYREVVETMVDTIVTLNNECQVLDVNSTPLAPLINRQIIDLDNPKSIFEVPIESSESINDEVTEVVLRDQDNTITIRYSYTTLIRKKECLGYVLVIEDYTRHEYMLLELEEKKQELELIKQDLLRYSRASKILSAEKERNRLLIEVQNDLGHQLAELSKYILNTRDVAIEVKNPEGDIDELQSYIIQGVKMAKKNLANIRETVRQYRSSYEDGNRL